MEPAATNIVTVDSIRRFGGSSAVAMPWPEEDDSMEDRFDRLEKLIISSVKKMNKAKRSKKKDVYIIFKFSIKSIYIYISLEIFKLISCK